MIEKLFEGCENLGWSVSEDQDAGTVELESYSPAGENLVVTVEKENFAEKVREYAEDFDIDEHIEMWVEARNNGVAGVPKSTRELVEDAESKCNEDPGNEAALYGEEYWNLVNYTETVLRTLLRDSKEKAGEE